MPAISMYGSLEDRLFRRELGSNLNSRYTKPRGIYGNKTFIRDLDIISEELRIKDIEFVEKAHENLVKQTRRGGQSLEMKKMKEEQACIEKVLNWLKDGKDVRHGDWSPKEVSKSFTLRFSIPSCFMMTKSYCSNNPSSSIGLTKYNA